jgi:HK97 family phage major capsid protein
MATEVEEMRHKLALVVKEREEFAAGFGAENLPTEDDERKLDAMMNGEADLRAELARVEKFSGASQPSGNGAAKANPAKTDGQARVATLGQQFVESQQYADAIAAYASADEKGQTRIPDGGKFNMSNLRVNSLLGSILGMNAALITGDSSTSAGAFVITDRDQELIRLGRKPIRIFDLISRMTTDSDLVDYVAELARTNAAAIRAEPTASGDGSGVAPESAFSFEVRQAAVKNVANWFPVTKQAVADVPQMRGIIDEELRDNLLEKLCDLVVNSSSGIIGLLQTSGRQSQAWDTNILTTTRKAKTIVGTVGREIPNAYVLNPADWETIDLLQDNEARYFYGGPAQVGIPRLWGLPVAEEEAVASSTGIVGNLMKARLWDRQQATLSISDSHADFFTRGLLAMLADLRAAFALRKPTAIVEIDLSA